MVPGFQGLQETNEKPKKQYLCLFKFISGRYNPGMRGQRIAIQCYGRGGGYWNPGMDKCQKREEALLYQRKITFCKRKNARNNLNNRKYY